MIVLTQLTDPDAVQAALFEFDKIGRKAFLEKYGYGKADRYFLKAGDRYYDSKAIAGAALTYQFPGKEIGKFSGVALGQAADVLKQLHFTIADGAPKYLALTENVVNANPKFSWQDVTGERYHFPNQYRNLIKPGAKFVYYRGGLRPSGKREIPEYFGVATVGDVYIDETTSELPAKNQAWFADIIDFYPFIKPIQFRDEGGIYLELGQSELPRENYWRTAVREIDRDRYEYICNVAGISLLESGAVTTSEPVRSPVLVSEDLMVERAVQSSKSEGGTARKSYRRLSGRAKIIGDLAEGVVCDWLKSQVTTANEKDAIVWVASQGETPGYDIEDRRNSHLIVGYEVKATTGTRFSSIEITENELRAAREMRDRYFLVLVANAEAASPSIQLIRDPARLIDEGKMLATPAVYRLELCAINESLQA